jgi:hypothetical protein
MVSSGLALALLAYFIIPPCNDSRTGHAVAKGFFAEVADNMENDQSTRLIYVTGTSMHGYSCSMLKLHYMLSIVHLSCGQYWADCRSVY